MRPAYLGGCLFVAASLWAAPPAPPRAEDDAGAPLVHLRFAELRDRDRSGGASAGDEVVLGLRRPLGPRRRCRSPTCRSRAPATAGARAPSSRRCRAATSSRHARARRGAHASPGRIGRARPRRRRRSCGRRADRCPSCPRPPTGARSRATAFPTARSCGRSTASSTRTPAYSDGLLTPADAYAAARAQGLSFFAVTDHLEQLDDAEWAETRAAAARAEAPGAFAALYGYEWGGAPSLGGWLNHVNVIGSDERLGTWTLRPAEPLLRHRPAARRARGRAVEPPRHGEGLAGPQQLERLRVRRGRRPADEARDGGDALGQRRGQPRGGGPRARARPRLARGAEGRGGQPHRELGPLAAPHGPLDPETRRRTCWPGSGAWRPSTRTIPTPASSSWATASG